VTEPAETIRPAFYAQRGNRLADWWTVLHPPYTAWHLSYAIFGAALVPNLNWAILGATVVAFFLAVGVAAHALDELHGRPLGTGISARTLRVVAAAALVGAVIIGVLTLPSTGTMLIPCIVVGVVLVLGYNLELFGGRLHTDLGFAAGWGGFPVAVGFLAQHPRLSLPLIASATAATFAAIALSYAQRRLSSPARLIRRRIVDIDGEAILADASRVPLDRLTLLAPLEGALQALSWGVPLTAAAVLLAQLR
jgi:hypothetical protein